MRFVLHSLDDQVKNEVASSDDTETFETLVSLPIKTDNCLQKRRVGENSRFQLSLKTGSGITKVSNRGVWREGREDLHSQAGEGWCLLWRQDEQNRIETD